MTIPEWAGEYVGLYTDYYGQMPDRWHLVQILKLRELDASYGDDCIKAFGLYMKLTDLKYFSVRHFMATYETWATPLVTKDAAIKRAFNAGLRGVDDKSIPAGGFQSERDFKKWLDIQLAKQDEDATK